MPGILIIKMFADKDLKRNVPGLLLKSLQFKTEAIARTNKSSSLISSFIQFFDFCPKAKSLHITLTNNIKYKILVFLSF